MLNLSKHLMAIMWLLAITFSFQANARDIVNLNSHWQFYKTTIDTKFSNIEKHAWREVSLPHTPQIEPELVNNQWQGFAFYQKQLNIKPEWQGKRLYLKFEGAMNHAKVWLNGELIKEHLGGYLPFTIDVTDKVVQGKANQLLVKLDNRDNPIIGPKPLNILDFNMYGGLYRDVNLIVKNPLHITDEILAAETAGGGIFVQFPNVDQAESELSIQTHLINHSDKTRHFSIQQQLKQGNATVANTRHNYQLLAGSKQHFNQTLKVKSPKLWSPKQPNLYTLITEIYDGDNIIDQVSQRVGIRKFEFDKKHQLLINGEVTWLRGVNRHQEHPFVGYATSKAADYRDAYRIKAAGFDYVRLSHYPHSKAFMQAADELGLVLLNAILGWQYYNPDPAFASQIKQTCRDLIRRDRNHASVLAWECSLNESAMPKAFVADLDSIVKQEYPGGYSAGWMKGYDIYLQARQHRLQHYETPNQPYNVSEYGDWEYYAQNAGLNQDSWQGLKEEERTSRQLLENGEKRLLQQALNIQEAHNDNYRVPAFADGYWVMYDYNRGYADDLEASGIMSLYRLPKYSYYFFQSQRDADDNAVPANSGPMVYIASDWESDSATRVKVYSNTDKVSLMLNGELVSTATPTNDSYSSHLPHPPFMFDLGKFTAGELTAVGYIDGKAVARHSIKTARKPVAIALEIDHSGKAPQTGQGDIVFVRAKLVDVNGQQVSTSGTVVEFDTTGDIEVINPETITTRKGIATALVKIGNTLNDATISADTDTLAGDTIAVTGDHK